MYVYASVQDWYIKTDVITLKVWASSPDPNRTAPEGTVRSGSTLFMHQSFVVQAPMGPGNSVAFNFSVFKALLNALHSRDKFMVKSLLKAPSRPLEVDNNEEQQMTWTI